MQNTANRLFWGLTTIVGFANLGLRIPVILCNVRIQDFLTHSLRTEGAYAKIYTYFLTSVLERVMHRPLHSWGKIRDYPLSRRMGSNHKPVLTSYHATRGAKINTTVTIGLYAFVMVEIISSVLKKLLKLSFKISSNIFCLQIKIVH